MFDESQVDRLGRAPDVSMVWIRTADQIDGRLPIGQGVHYYPEPPKIKHALERTLLDFQRDLMIA